MPSPLKDFSIKAPLGPVIAEGRVLDAVAGRDIRGTLDDIADSLGISYSDLRSAIDELTKIGWISLELLGEGLVLSLPEDARVAS
jgi:DNA-binding MarR family transcriptional regulator